jgi:hypothetical protein
MHYPGDVLSGATIGTLIGWLVASLGFTFGHRRQHEWYRWFCEELWLQRSLHEKGTSALLDLHNAVAQGEDIELPPDPDKLTEICVDGRHSETFNPALEDLLSVLDETERLARTQHNLGDC